MALLGVTVLVAIALLRHVGGSTTASTAAATASTTTTTILAEPTTVTTTVPPVPPAQVKLLVLNGTGAGSLAGQTSRALQAGQGYDTLAPDNTTSAVTTSEIYAATPAYVGAAQALAAVVHLSPSLVVTPIPSVAPIRSTERTLADVVLVIGPGFTVPAVTSTSTATTVAGTPTTKAGASG